MIKLVKSIILASVLTLSGQAVDTNVKWSDAQKSVIKESYELGEPFGVGYTLAAISIHESKAGRFKINLNDPSCGNYHAYLPTVLSRHDMDDNIWNRNLMCTRLIEDNKLASSEAINELKFWYNVYVDKPGRYTSMLQSYNAGWKKENGAKYARIIKDWVKYLQNHPELIKG